MPQAPLDAGGGGGGRPAGQSLTVTAPCAGVLKKDDSSLFFFPVTLREFRVRELVSPQAHIWRAASKEHVPPCPSPVPPCTPPCPPSSRLRNEELFAIISGFGGGASGN